eukprot:154553_1
MLHKLSRVPLASTPKYISRSRYAFSAQAQVQIDRDQPFFDIETFTQQETHVSLSSQQQIELDRPPVIEPKFYHEGQFVMEADKFVIDCRKYQHDGVNPSNSALRAEMEQKFKDAGLVYLINTELTETRAMRDLSAILVPRDIAMEYKGGSNWRNWIEPNVYDTGAPKEAWVHYH